MAAGVLRHPRGQVAKASPRLPIGSRTSHGGGPPPTPMQCSSRLTGNSLSSAWCRGSLERRPPRAGRPCRRFHQVSGRSCSLWQCIHPGRSSINELTPPACHRLLGHGPRSMSPRRPKATMIYLALITELVVI
jgi:hypothetical protein